MIFLCKATRFSLCSAILTFILVLTSVIEVEAQLKLPQYTDFEKPSPAPSAPGEPFAPLMSGKAAGSVPGCAEWNRTAGPNENIVISGSKFTSFKGIDSGKDTRFKIYSSEGGYKDAEIQRVEDDKAVITVNKSVPSWSMYLIWPGNSSGFGQPIAVNKTDAWWVGPDRATTESIVSVYGRNLSRNNGSQSSNVYIKTANGSGQWAKVTQVNPYKVDFVVPSGLTEGLYEVWVHNGHGGEFGWSGPLKVTVVSPVNWTDKVFNVKSYGAKGNGSQDDTEAIKRTLKAAKSSPGSTVYFPKGTYLISSNLNPSNNTKWKGDGRSNTLIMCKKGFKSKSEGMIYGSVNTFEVSNLTFDGNGSFKAVHSEPIFLRGSSNLRFKDVNFSFSGFNILQLDNTSSVHIINCDLIGKISFLGKSSQLFIDRCNFYLTDDTELALHSWAGVGISLTNSTCQDYDNSNPKNGSGWGKGRFFVGAGNAGSGGYTYIANNRTTNLSVRESGSVDQNSGEQFLWEGFASLYSGSVVSSSASNTKLSGFSLRLDTRKYAVIIKGKGLGQARRITAINGSSITLERPWNLVPDAKSVIAVGHYADRIVLYENYIDGKPGAVKNVNHNASSGIQPYGGVFNFIADKNTINEVRTGIANWATQHSAGVDPNYFNLFVNNKITNCRFGIQSGLDHYRTPETALLGSIFRNNVVENTLESAIVNTVKKAKNPVLENFVYEHNIFASVKRAYSTGGDSGLPNGFPTEDNGIKSQIFYRNNFSSGNGSAGGIKVTPGIVLRENTYSGFSPVYLEKASEPVIEAPQHVLELTGTVGGGLEKASFSVWNSGTSVIDWKATTNASWLSLSQNQGSIKNEGLSGIIGLQANPKQLSAGNHEADITITSGQASARYKVIFKVLSSNSPVVAITSPKDGSVVTGPASFVIEAEANDPDGSVKKVEFFADGERIGEDISSPYSFTWKNVLAGNYALTAKATDNLGNAETSAGVEVEVTDFALNCEGTGTIQWEYWSGIAGNGVSVVPVTSPPSEIKTLTSFASPVGFADRYGSRIRGYICPPTTGNYVFYLASDDNSELWLSTTDQPSQKRKIAYVSEWTNPREYTRFSSQRSKSVYLKAGTRYYIEAIHKEGNGAEDHLSVGWELPDGTLQRPIAGASLIPYEFSDYETPVVMITSPEHGEETFSSERIEISAEAKNFGGEVKKVEFFADDKKIGEVSGKPYTFLWANPSAGTYVLNAKATGYTGNTVISTPVQIVVSNSDKECAGTGSIDLEYWADVDGKHVSAIPVHTPPTGIKTLSHFASPVGFSDNYGSRLRGYICPPVTGEYVFYIAGDDNSELWLSTDGQPENKRKIAYVNGWTNPGEYDKHASQQSKAVFLTAGQSYYIEALHKEGDGKTDHLSVGWKLPDGSLQKPIAGAYLIPFSTEKFRTTVASRSAGTFSALELNNNALTVQTTQLIAFPNPSSQYVNLEFTSAETGNAQLQVFSLQGVLIETLFSGDSEAGITRAFRFEGGRYPSGTYMVKLKCGNKVITKLIVINP